MINRLKRLQRKQLIVILVCLTMLVLALSRSWIRNSVLSWYGNQVMSQKVNDAFTSSFSAVNVQFKKSDVNPQQSSTAHTDPTCGTQNYHYFHVTVQCLILAMDSKSPIPQALITDWPNIIKALGMNGTPRSWKVGPYYVPTTFNANTSSDPKNLFIFNDSGRNEVNFIRQINGVKCDLDINVNPPQGVYPSQYNVYEGCYNTINFFGGWNCSKEYCTP